MTKMTGENATCCRRSRGVRRGAAFEIDVAREDARDSVLRGHAARIRCQRATPRSAAIVADDRDCKGRANSRRVWRPGRGTRRGSRSRGSQANGARLLDVLQPAGQRVGPSRRCAAAPARRRAARVRAATRARAIALMRTIRSCERRVDRDVRILGRGRARARLPTSRPRRWRCRCRSRWSRCGPCRGTGRCP